MLTLEARHRNETQFLLRLKILEEALFMKTDIHKALKKVEKDIMALRKALKEEPEIYDDGNLYGLLCGIVSSIDGKIEDLKGYYQFKLFGE